MTVVPVVAMILIALLCLYSCADLALDEPAALTDDFSDAVVSDESNGDSLTDGTEAGVDLDIGEGTKAQDDPESHEGEGSGTSGQTEESDPSTESGSATSEGETHSDDDGAGSSDGTGELIIKDGYIRMNSLLSDRDFTIYVLGEEIGRARITAGGYLETEDLVEGRLELWGKVNEYEHLSYYVYFECTEQYHEVNIRAEIPVVEIDLTREELTLLLPTSSLEGQGESGEGEGENDPKQGEGIADPSEETEGGDARCERCGVLLTQAAEHRAECVYYAAIPDASAAHDFLEGLPGVRESLAVTVLDEESEIYSFTLNYLTAEGVSAVENLMRSCTVLNETDLGEGSMEYRVRKIIGVKVFTIVARVDPRGAHYTASLDLSGFVLE